MSSDATARAYLPRAPADAAFSTPAGTIENTRVANKPRRHVRRDGNVRSRPILSLDRPFDSRRSTSAACVGRQAHARAQPGRRGRSSATKDTIPAPRAKSSPRMRNDPDRHRPGEAPADSVGVSRRTIAAGRCVRAVTGMCCRSGPRVTRGIRHVPAPVMRPHNIRHPNHRFGGQFSDFFQDRRDARLVGAAPCGAGFRPAAGATLRCGTGFQPVRVAQISNPCG